MKKEKNTNKPVAAYEVDGETVDESVDEIMGIEDEQIIHEASSLSTTPSITPEQLMYVGPTLLNPIHVQHRSVYVGGIPVSAKKLVEKDIELAACFLPLSEAGKVLRELERDDAQSSDYARRFKIIQKRYTTVNKGE